MIERQRNRLARRLHYCVAFDSIYKFRIENDVGTLGRGSACMFHLDSQYTYNVSSVRTLVEQIQLFSSIGIDLSGTELGEQYI